MDSRHGPSGWRKVLTRYPFAEADEARREITAEELGALLSGIDLSTAKPQAVSAGKRGSRIKIGFGCILCLAGGRVRL